MTKHRAFSHLRGGWWLGPNSLYGYIGKYQKYLDLSQIYIIYYPLNVIGIHTIWSKLIHHFKNESQKGDADKYYLNAGKWTVHLYYITLQLQNTCTSITTRLVILTVIERCLDLSMFPSISLCERYLWYKIYCEKDRSTELRVLNIIERRRSQLIEIIPSLLMADILSLLQQSRSEFSYVCWDGKYIAYQGPGVHFTLYHDGDAWMYLLSSKW